MAMPLTETPHKAAEGLDARPDQEILVSILDAQVDALRAVTSAIPQICAAAHMMANTVEAGGRLIYAAAGSSGLMAMADALELGGTFGIATDRVAVLMAGGMPVDSNMPGGTEDDTGAAERDAQTIGKDDCLIAITASGTTPYPMTIARIARGRGASVICIANNRGAPIFEHASVAVCLQTPPEVIAGSTRMGAATAQKAALNMMSTLMGIRLGHVFDGMMVNVIADNQKLRARAASMVRRIARVDEETAKDCLARAGGAVKPAVLLAAGAGSLEDANAMLDRSKGHLRAALGRV